MGLYLPGWYLQQLFSTEMAAVAWGGTALTPNTPGSLANIRWRQLDRG
jgi:hypothetical protein